MKTQSYLKIIYERPSNEEKCDSSNFKYRTTPFSCSEISKCPIHSYEVLVDEDNRSVFDLKFSSANIPYNFEPGSTIGILPANDEKVVDQLLIRLGIESVANSYFKLSIISNVTKKNACIPKHIPKNGTLRNVFLYHVDIRSIPKKLFLKCLLQFVDNSKEHEELALLCSPKGSEQYNKLISSYSERSLLGLLDQFPSCHPPIEILLEHLPPLLPRPYSISSSPLNKEYFTITFNVDTFSNNKKGLCSSWLEKCIDKFKETSFCEVPIYFRTPSTFQLPKDNSTSILLIATGTGIAPFKGFLEHRHLEIELQNKSFGETWLFYGCRDSCENYLFKEELKLYLKSGALSKIFESFSRETENKNYVQHNIEKYGKELSSFIVDTKPTVYVCGDFVKVLPEVKKSILKILMKFSGFSKEESELYLKDMETGQRYIVDSWT